METDPAPAFAIASTLAFGGAEIGNLHRAIDETEARSVLEAAAAAGMTLFDTAPGYGKGLSELRIGAFLRDFAGKGLRLSTKVGRHLVRGTDAGRREFFAAPLPFAARFDYGYDGIMRGFEQSMTRLGVTRTDLLFVHDLDQGNHGDATEAHFTALMDGGLRALEELKRCGDAGRIGVAINQPDIGARMIAGADFDVALLASRYTLLDQSGLTDLLPLAVKRGVSVLAGGVFNSGILASGAVPGARYDYVEAGDATMRKVAALEALCVRHAVPLATAAMRFALAHPAIDQILVGTSRASRIAETVAALRHPVPSAFWAELRDRALVERAAPLPC